MEVSRSRDNGGFGVCVCLHGVFVAFIRGFFRQEIETNGRLVLAVSSLALFSAFICRGDARR